MVDYMYLMQLLVNNSQDLLKMIKEENMMLRNIEKEFLVFMLIKL